MAAVISSDPRIYFAAERTLLAWIRTGIAVMAFGFVVARFGAFLAVLPVTADGFESSWLSPYIGAALVALGVVSIVAGATEFSRYWRTLPPDDLPKPQAARVPLLLSWALVIVGIVLVAVLLA